MPRKQGLIQLNDQLIRSLRKVFVKQCRVDPLINCESNYESSISTLVKTIKTEGKFFADTLINGKPIQSRS